MCGEVRETVIDYWFTNRFLALLASGNSSNDANKSEYDEELHDEGVYVMRLRMLLYWWTQFLALLFESCVGFVTLFCQKSCKINDCFRLYLHYILHMDVSCTLYSLTLLQLWGKFVICFINYTQNLSIFLLNSLPLRDY